MDTIKEISPDMENRDKYEYINLKPADNGWIVSYECYKNAPTKSESYYDYKTEVFTLEQTNEAFEKVKNLYKENLIHKVQSEKDMDKKAIMLKALMGDND